MNLIFQYLNLAVSSNGSQLFSSPTIKCESFTLFVLNIWTSHGIFKIVVLGEKVRYQRKIYILIKSKSDLNILKISDFSNFLPKKYSFRKIWKTSKVLSFEVKFFISLN